MVHKQQGHTRAVTPTSKAIEKSKQKFYKEIQTGKYDLERSILFENGGFLLLYKDRGVVESNLEAFNNEYNVAIMMAREGYQMIMTPEKGEEFVLARYNGKNKYGDGKISVTSYEQRTLSPINEEFRINVMNAINHARKKNAEIAVLFDNKGLLHRNHIAGGMNDFIKKMQGAFHQSVKMVITVNSKGEVHEWVF